MRKKLCDANRRENIINLKIRHGIIEDLLNCTPVILFSPLPMKLKAFLVTQNESPKMVNMSASKLSKEVVEHAPCTSENHGLPHWKCVLRFFDKCPSITLSIQESDKYTTHTFSTICFHIYCNISRCTVHIRCPYN